MTLPISKAERRYAIELNGQIAYFDPDTDTDYYWQSIGDGLTEITLSGPLGHRSMTFKNKTEMHSVFEQICTIHHSRAGYDTARNTYTIRGQRHLMVLPAERILGVSMDQLSDTLLRVMLANNMESLTRSQYTILTENAAERQQIYNGLSQFLLRDNPIMTKLHSEGGTK